MLVGTIDAMGLLAEVLMGPFVAAVVAVAFMASFVAACGLVARLVYGRP